MNLIDQLDDLAAVSTQGSADRLRGRAADLEARVERGRRARDVGMGAGVAAAIGAVVTGALLLPRQDGNDPAANPEPSLGLPQLALEQGQPVACGTALDTSATEVIHDPAVLARVRADGTFTNQDAIIYAGAERALWTVDGSWSMPGDRVQWAALALVLRDGVVVGSGAAQTEAPSTGFGLALGLDPAVAGSCTQDAPVLTDGVYTSVAVMQAQDPATGEPLATFMFTKKVGFSGLSPDSTNGGWG